MSRHRIRRMIFWLEGVLIQPSGDWETGLLPLLEDLASRVDLGLISGHPPEAISRLSETAPEAIRTLLAETLPAAPYQALIAEGRLTPGETLIVDHHALRAGDAIRAGLDSAIYVDPARLARDLHLWGLVEG